MAARKSELIAWCNMGKDADCTHMIVVCDTYDYDDYPVWIGEKTPWGSNNGREFWEVYDEYEAKSMQRIVEVYDLSIDIDLQMCEVRAWHYPPRPTRDTLEA